MVEGNQVLMCYVSEGNIEQAKILLAKGTDGYNLEFKNEGGLSLLAVAIRN